MDALGEDNDEVAALIDIGCMARSDSDASVGVLSFQPQAQPIDGFNSGAIDVDQNDSLTRLRKISADKSSERTGAKDRGMHRRHLLHRSSMACVSRWCANADPTSR